MGQYLVTFLEVQQMFQKILQYVRESKLAILKQFETPHKPQNTLKNQEQQNIA